MSSGSGALLGRVVAGKLMIEELVGSGAMGEVFRARVQGRVIGQKVPLSALDDATQGATASQWLDLHP